MLNSGGRCRQPRDRRCTGLKHAPEGSGSSSSSTTAAAADPARELVSTHGCLARCTAARTGVRRSNGSADRSRWRSWRFLALVGVLRHSPCHLMWHALTKRNLSGERTCIGGKGSTGGRPLSKSRKNDPIGAAGIACPSSAIGSIAGLQVSKWRSRQSGTSRGATKQYLGAAALGPAAAALRGRAAAGAAGTLWRGADESGAEAPAVGPLTGALGAGAGAG